MGELFAKSSPTPLQKFSQKRTKNKFVSTQTDGRREDEPRFCCRKRLGTTTLLAKKVVLHQMIFVGGRRSEAARAEGMTVRWTVGT